PMLRRYVLLSSLTSPCPSHLYTLSLHDALPISALMLVAMIRDIGNEIGIGAVALFEHAIFVVAERGRAEPECPVRLERMAFGRKLGERGVDQAPLVNRGLT